MARVGLALGELGEPWVTKKGDRFQARVRIHDLDGKIREVSALGDTDSKARRALDDSLRRRSARKGRAGGEPGDQTFGEVSAKWIARRRADSNVKPNTIAQYAATLDGVLLPELADVRLRDCNRYLLLDTLDRIREGKRSGSFADGQPREGRAVKGKQPETVLGMVIRWAWEQDWIDHFPLEQRSRERGTGKSKTEREKKIAQMTDGETYPDAVRALTRKEQARLGELLRQAEQPRVRADGKPMGGVRSNTDLRDVCTVMLGTGLRIGEVVALRWKDLDLDARVPLLHVRGTFVESRGSDVSGPQRGNPKSKDSWRTLVMPPDVVQALRDRRDRKSAKAKPYRGQKTVVHPRRVQPEDYVFASRSGEMIWPGNLRTRFREVIKGTEFDTGDPALNITPHNLRKTFATEMRRRRSAEEVRIAMGHATAAIADRYYVEHQVKSIDIRQVGTSLAPEPPPARTILSHPEDHEFQ